MLLIAEIDLSVGAVSGLCAGIMAVLSVKSELSAPVAIGAGILAGAGIGLLQGFWMAKLRVPSFVVTLAGLLGWQGALLYVLGSTGTVNLSDPLILGLANSQLPIGLGWLVGLIFVGGYAFSLFNKRQQRGRAGVQAQPVTALVGRIALVAGGVLIAIGIMSVNRNPNPDIPIQGVPSAVLIFIGFIVLFDFIVRRYSGKPGISSIATSSIGMPWTPPSSLMGQLEA